MKPSELQPWDIIRHKEYKQLLVVGQVLGKYAGGIEINKNDRTASVTSFPYPDSWAIQLMGTKSVVTISNIMFEVDEIWRDKVKIYG